MTTKVYGFNFFQWCRDIAETLLKVALNTIKHKPPVVMRFGDMYLHLVSHEDIKFIVCLWLICIKPQIVIFIPIVKIY